MKFPTLVYKTPGIHQRPGFSYRYKQVCNDNELSEAIDAGWFPTLAAARNPAAFDVETFIVENSSEMAYQKQQERPPEKLIHPETPKKPKRGRPRKTEQVLNNELD